MATPANLPTGTVTLLFADVEGSTRLLYLLGERFGPARIRMRELVRAAASAHEGAEVDWAGDGVFLAFARARNAVAAAAQIQHSLAAEPWPADGVHRLRMGLHTGEPELGTEGYVGADVVIASRICSVAHGEQVVVSRAVRDVAGDEPVPGGSFRPLGRHRLKDVPAPEMLFQLVAPDLRRDFPPLKTLSANSLPALHHRLVGRADPLARVEGLLHDGVRLVTITGPGGAGKSRLALEIAAGAAVQRPVHLVGLAPIAEPDLVPSAIARTLGVRESGGEPLLEAIGDKLNGTETLLYLDNFEHLTSAAVHVAQLLDRAPDLQVLVTSRTPLRLSTEHVMLLDPLSIEDAITLFLELAAARGVVLQPDALASVHEICRTLDGLPLAIELVAARLVVLPPAEIVRALGEGLALEMEGPVDLPERQRTLRAAIDWSYSRLTESQQALHGTLAVFADGAALDDARAVASESSTFLADLEALVGWSLVRSESSDGSVRLSMLETVRQDAVARLAAAGNLEGVRKRHAERFIDVAQTAESELSGPDQADWLERLEHELDNMRATLDWCLATGSVEDGLRVMSALSRFWRARGHVTEARRWLSLGLARGTDVDPNVRIDAMWTAARQATAQMDIEAAVPLLEDVVRLTRERGRSREQTFALSELAWIALERGETRRAEALCNEALAVAEAAGDVRARSGALRILSDVHAAGDDFARAIELQDEALALRRTLGDPLLVADATYHLGVALFRSGDGERARHAFDESLAIARDLGEETQSAASLFMLAVLDLLAGDLGRAEHQIAESLEVYTRVENDRDRAECLVVLAGVEAAKGSFENAARLLGAADGLRGDSSLDAYELPVLERFGPDLEAALGADRLARLRLEGSTMDPSTFGAKVVAGAGEE